MQRVAIIGPSGAGKSTLARELGARTGLPVVHLDTYYWHAGWTPTPSEVWRKRQKRLLEPERWIVDGNYGSTLDLRLGAADTVIFLDFHRFLCTYRVLKRLVTYRGERRPDLAEGCGEKFAWNFMKFVWTFPEQHRPNILERLEHHRDGLGIVILHSPREVETFLENLG